ncbi:MAG: D-alanyl-D-alanine carboxypeptidase, partial [Ilumatobacteraceae bacterium]
MWESLRGARRRAARFDRHLLTVDTQRAVVSVIVACVVVFVPIFSAWQVARSSAGAAEPLSLPLATEPAPTEPIFSVRRIARTTAIEARVSNVRSLLADFTKALPPDSCVVVRAETREVSATRASRPLIPASNMKLLVAAAALDVLGADYRFTTSLIGNRVGDTIVGNLWLVGGGDPVLSTRAYPPTQLYPTTSPTFLDSLADELRASGINKITGSVVGDESRYDDERYVPTWGDGIRSIEAGPLGALMVDDGTLLGDPFKPAQPAVGAATAFTRLLRARGITVIAAPRSGVAPTDGVTIGEVISAPLGVLLGDVLANSDNNAAELLMKEIGLVYEGSPATRVGEP